MIADSDKKMFSTRLSTSTIKAAKHLSVDTDKTVSELTEEAFLDLLEKYKDVANK